MPPGPQALKGEAPYNTHGVRYHVVRCRHCRRNFPDTCQDCKRSFIGINDSCTDLLEQATERSKKSSRGAQKEVGDKGAVDCCSCRSLGKSTAAVFTTSDGRSLCKSCVDQPLRFFDMLPELRNEVYRTFLVSRPEDVHLFRTTTTPSLTEDGEKGAMVGFKQNTRVVYPKSPVHKKPYARQTLLCRSPLMLISKQFNAEFYDQWEWTVYGDRESARCGLLFKITNWNFNPVIKYLKSLKKTQQEAIISGKATLHLSLQVMPYMYLTHRAGTSPDDSVYMHGSFGEFVSLCQKKNLTCLHDSYVLESFYLPSVLVPKEVYEWQEDLSDRDENTAEDEWATSYVADPILKFVDTWTEYLLENSTFSREELRGETGFRIISEAMNSCSKKAMILFKNSESELPEDDEGGLFECTAPPCACGRSLLSDKELRKY